MERTCSEGRYKRNEASPFGGPDPEPTSSLSRSAAIGVGVGIISLIMVLIGITFCVWKVRGQRRSNESIEAPPVSHFRSPSDATDQKTLVASFPNSPQHAYFQNQVMTPDLFVEALGNNESRRGEAEHNGQGTTSGSYRIEDVTGKELPTPPPTESQPPPQPTEPVRYAINVSINKSMIFDDEMVRAVSPLREPAAPRGRAPKYIFKEYLPPVHNSPPTSVQPVLNKRGSDHELDRYPSKDISIHTSTTEDNSSENELGSPVDTILSKLESAPPQLPLPDLPPPSPSFSFCSYDWYQDIIDNRTSTHTPTQATFSRPFSSSPNSRSSSARVPEPLLLSANPPPSASLLHPDSAALQSPSSPHFRLSPTVYKPSQPLQPPAVPPTPPPVSTRTSGLSTMTRTTHNSRSWLPDDGLYLAEEGTNSYMAFSRSNDECLPTSYSPLT